MTRSPLHVVDELEREEPEDSEGDEVHHDETEVQHLIPHICRHVRRDEDILSTRDRASRSIHQDGIRAVAGTEARDELGGGTGEGQTAHLVLDRGGERVPTRQDEEEKG